MFSYAVEIKERGDTAWHSLSGWVQPFTYGTTLDDSLDSGKIMISQSEREAIIKPFTRIRITISEDGAEKDTIDCIVANSDRVMRRMSETKLYDHTLELVELTKLLEREVCDTMTVTNYLGHDFAAGATPVDPVYEITNDLNNPRDIETQVITPILYSPQIIGNTIRVPIVRVKATMGNSGSSWMRYQLSVVAPDGSETYFGTPYENGDPQIFGADSNGAVYPEAGNPDFNYTLTQEGTYLFKGYHDKSFPEGATRAITTTFSVSAVKVLSAGDDWDISEVVRRLLSAGVTRKTTEKQKFKFDSTQDGKFASMKSPEFFFTRGTLRDALSTVGGYLHGIPRLVEAVNEKGEEQLTVKFDMLSEGGQYAGTLPPAVYDDKQLIGDEYAGTFDSTVQNMLNTTNAETAAVVEPSAGTFRAINAAPGGFRIAANAEPVIPTDKPIYQVKKLEFWYSVENDERAVDITPYVYENAEYSTLSSFGGAYPYSKSYALVYTQGQKNISGLTFVKSATSTDTLDSDYEYALVNILKLATGNDAISANNMAGYQFRITYIPYVTARVKQRKPYLTHPVDNTLIYNQAGNSVESEYYGENIRGAIMRTGNTAQTKTYVFGHYDDIPKIGQRIGRDYVAKVDAEYAKTYIKATVVTVKGFNKLAEYTGINSNYRLYDISEKQSVDRQINYSETCLLTTGYMSEEEALKFVGHVGSVTLHGVVAMASAFADAVLPDMEVFTPGRISATEIVSKTGRDPGTPETPAPGTQIDPRIAQAAGAFACGNSIVLYTQMLDNFGAGYQSIDESDNAYQRAQKLVPYGDTFGNISTAQVKWGPTISPSPSDSATSNPSPPQSFEYPEAKGATTVDKPYFVNELVISKDSREALSLAYQLHFQAVSTDIIIGAGLAKYCTLVQGEPPLFDSLFDVYFLPRALDPMTKIVDTTGGAKGENLVACTITLYEGTAYGFDIGTPNNTLEGAKSWAFVHRDTKELIVGCNKDLALGENGDITFWFCNNDYLKTLEMAD